MAYQKQNFKDGDTLYAKQLEKIEDELIDLGEKIENEILQTKEEFIKGRYDSQEKKFYVDDKEIIGDEKKLYLDIETKELYHFLDSKFILLNISSSSQIWRGEGKPTNTTDEQILGIDYKEGKIYYKDKNNIWKLVIGGGSNDQIVTEVEIKVKDITTSTNQDDIVDTINISGSIEEYKIKFYWQSINSLDRSPLLNKCKVEIIVKNALKERFEEFSTTDERDPVEVEKDIKKYLNSGVNLIEIKVTDAFGKTSSVYFSITVIDIKLTKTSYIQNTLVYQNSLSPASDSIEYNVYLQGSGPKILYVKVYLKEETYTYEQEVMSNLTSVRFKIPRKETIQGKEIYCHGSYPVEIYAVNQNDTSIKSNILYFDFIWVDNVNNNNKAILASSFNRKKAEQYEILKIPYYIHKPGQNSCYARFKGYKKIKNEDGSFTLEEVPSLLTDSISKETDKTLEWNVSYNEEIKENEIEKIVLEVEIGTATIENEKIINFIREDYKNFELEISYVKIPNIMPRSTDLGISFVADKTDNDDKLTRDIWKSTGECKDENEQTLKAFFSENFDWKNGGWNIKDNRKSLKITNNSKLTIPYKLFYQDRIGDFQPDIHRDGFVVELDVSFEDVTDFNKPFFTCYDEERGKGIKITPHEATFSNGIATPVSIKYENSESKSYSNSMHFAFVITPEQPKDVKDEGTGDISSVNMGGMYIYINGVGAAAQEYKRTDTTNQFKQEQVIEFNSENCTINLFSFRMYYSQLTPSEIINNWIADMTPNNKTLAYTRNRVYDENNVDEEDGDYAISFSRAKTQIPCMTIIGEMPTYKGDKKTVAIKFEGTEGGLYDFELGDPKLAGVTEYDKLGNLGIAQIDVQGTSSQYYPVKNWKFKSKYKIKDSQGVEQKPSYPFITGPSKEESVTYSLDENQIPSTVFCLKADYMETSSTHNTVTANIANSMYDDTDYGKTPPQKKDETGRTRTTIYGRPILVFYKLNENEPPVFGGKYNFNYDKDSEEVFGFVPPKEEEDGYDDFEVIECIEFKENRDTIGLFQDRFSTEPITITASEVQDYDEREVDVNNLTVPKWAKAFEFRAYYRKEDEGTPEARYRYLKPVADWVYELNANTATNSLLSENKQTIFEEGSAYYEYDLNMNKVIFEYAPSGYNSKAIRSSLDLGLKVPNEVDYEIETFYEIKYKENEDSQKEEKFIIPKEQWEKRILNIPDTSNYNIKLIYEISYIDILGNKVIQTNEYLREEWENFAFEIPEEIEYKKQTYFKVDYIKDETKEILKTEIYTKDQWVKINEGADLEIGEGISLSIQKYYEINYISTLLNKVLKTEKYLATDDNWKDLTSDFPENIDVRINKIYRINFDNNMPEEEYSKEEWETKVLNPSRELFPTAVEPIKTRIYYALPWLPDEPDNKEKYNIGKEVYRFSKDSRNYRLSRFKTELPEHFNKHFCLMYFNLMEMLGMVDSSTKNMFWATWGERHSKHQAKKEDGKYKDNIVIWYPIFYDMDTMLGIDNVGIMEIPYNVEYDTVLPNGEHAYNGYGNVFWENFREVFAVELSDLFREKVTNNVFSLSGLLNQYEKHSDNFCEYIYNKDGNLKILNQYFSGYDVILGEDKDGKPLIEKQYPDWLYVYQGDRYYYRNFWLPNRFNYICSKNRAGQYATDFISMRLNDPRLSGVTGSETPNYDFTIETWKDQYVRVKYGGLSVAKRFSANVPDKIESPQNSYNDTETAIYGASNIKSIGNLGNKYANSIKLERAKKLLSFDCGSGKIGYSNLALTEITFGNLPLLQDVNLEGCQGLTSSIGLEECSSIRNVNLKRTKITSVDLPKQGVLETLSLPHTITSLIITNHNNLKNFELATDPNEGKDGQTKYNIRNLRVENTPQISTQEIVEDCIEKLDTLNLKDVEWTMNDATLLYRIMERGQSNSNKLEGDNGYPTLHGDFYVAEISKNLLKELNEYFNGGSVAENLKDRNFRLNYGNLTNTETIRFVEIVDGNEVKIPTKLINDQVVRGNPISFEEFRLEDGYPSKEDTYNCSFKFIGWNAKDSNGDFIKDGEENKLYKVNIESGEFDVLPKANDSYTFIAVYKTSYYDFIYTFNSPHPLEPGKYSETIKLTTNDSPLPPVPPNFDYEPGETDSKSRKTDIFTYWKCTSNLNSDYDIQKDEEIIPLEIEDGSGGFIRELIYTAQFDTKDKYRITFKDHKGILQDWDESVFYISKDQDGNNSIIPGDEFITPNPDIFKYHDYENTYDFDYWQIGSYTIKNNQKISLDELKSQGLFTKENKNEITFEAIYKSTEKKYTVNIYHTIQKYPNTSTNVYSDFTTHKVPLNTVITLNDLTENEGFNSLGYWKINEKKFEGNQFTLNEAELKRLGFNSTETKIDIYGMFELRTITITFNYFETNNTYLSTNGKNTSITENYNYGSQIDFDILRKNKIHKYSTYYTQGYVQKSGNNGWSPVPTNSIATENRTFTAVYDSSNTSTRQFQVVWSNGVDREEKWYEVGTTFTSDSELVDASASPPVLKVYNPSWFKGDQKTRKDGKRFGRTLTPTSKIEDGTKITGPTVFKLPYRECVIKEDLTWDDSISPAEYHGRITEDTGTSFFGHSYWDGIIPKYAGYKKFKCNLAGISSNDGIKIEEVVASCKANGSYTSANVGHVVIANGSHVAVVDNGSNLNDKTNVSCEMTANIDKDTSMTNLSNTGPFDKNWFWFGATNTIPNSWVKIYEMKFKITFLTNKITNYDVSIDTGGHNEEKFEIK